MTKRKDYWNDPAFKSGQMFDLTLKNESEMSEVEKRVFNQMAYEAANNMLNGGRVPALSSKSHDFRKRVGEHANAMQVEANRRAGNHHLNQPRNDAGRYTTEQEPQGESQDMGIVEKGILEALKSDK